MSLNVQNAKIELIQWLTTIEDSSIIQKLIDLRNREVKDWWDDLSEEEKYSIEQGINDSNNGRVVPHSEVRKIYEKWL